MKKEKTINILTTIAYLFLIGLLFFNFYGLTRKYHKEEMNMIMETEEAIRDALNETSDDAIGKALSEARQTYSFDIVITRGQDIIFKTVPYEVGESLLNRTHENARSREAQGHYEANGDRFFVWYSVYRLNDSVFINSFLWSVLYIVLIVTALVVLTVSLIFKSLFDPLKNIKQSIERAKEYDFELIEKPEDNINRSFQDFVSRLETDISVVSRQHTELEKQLQAKREHLNNIVVVSRSMVHDLKTPVHRSIIQNEVAAKEKAYDPDLLEITEINNEINNQLMTDINRILRMLKEDSEHYVLEFTKINIVDVLLRSITSFSPEINEKQLTLDFDAPESIDLETEESTFILLINNLLSNMVQYSSKDSIISVYADQKDDETVLRFTNTATSEDIKRMKNSEQLFNTVKSNYDDKYVYSSGNGLYLIKELTHMLKGTYELRTEGNHVIIEVIFNEQ